MRPRRATRAALGAVAVALALAAAARGLAASPPSLPVKVRHVEGQLHGFLELRTRSGETLAVGDLSQEVRGSRVTARLVFRFRDGSVNDEVVVFSQQGAFKVLSYRLQQKGPAFERPLELVVDGRSGEVTVRAQDDGKDKIYRERFDLPPDLANGILPVLLKNIDRRASSTTLSMIFATPRPRLVRLRVSPVGEDTFTVAGAARKAVHFLVKVELGGLAGAIAPLVGKQPPDGHVWIFGGPSPVFVRSESPLAMDGPPLRVDVVGPSWPARD